MKKLLIIVLSLTVLLFAAGITGIMIYESVDESKVPLVSVNVFSTEISPKSYYWQAAVYGGLFYKEFRSEHEDQAADIGELSDFAADLILPEGYEASYELFYGGDFISAGGAWQLDEALYSGPGEYELSLTLEKPAGSREDYGSFSFGIKFEVPYPEPEFFAGNTSLFQGEVFVIKLINVAPHVIPAAETGLGMSIFTQQEEGVWFAAIPVGNTRAAGNYIVKARAGEHEWETTVTVKAFSFDTQNLIIDTSNPTISVANSAEAYAEYREKIPPLYDTYDSDIYWEDTFIRPVSGRISTSFGSIRYTNSNWSNPRYHWGMDIAADEGVPVIAPNDGRVVFAEYLLNTGNTAVIEHGGGLKSYYYHMNALYVNAGDMVNKGAFIGEVGSTGYSTGPHLHFEMRIGNQAINPSMLFEQSASLYSLRGIQWK